MHVFSHAMHGLGRQSLHRTRHSPPSLIYRHHPEVTAIKAHPDPDFPFATRAGELALDSKVISQGLLPQSHIS